MNPPTERRAAVALAYAANDPAPRVVAKGRGLIAQAIIDRARAAGVYVHDSPELVGLLMQVDLDRHIPPQLYVAVAEILAWLYRLEQNAAHATVQETSTSAWGASTSAGATSASAGGASASAPERSASAQEARRDGAARG